jgi:hypothetical protein
MPDRRDRGGKIMRRAVALTLMALSIAVLAPCSGASAAWNCQAESGSGTASGAGSSRKEAEDRALGNCAATSARFAICRIVTCRWGRRS